MICCKTIFTRLISNSKRFLLLLTETVAEGEAVVEHAESNIHLDARGMLEVHYQFIMRITDLALLTPHGFPCIMHETVVRTLQSKVAGQILPHTLQSECRPINHRLTVMGNGILRRALFRQAERKMNTAVR